MTFCHFGRVAAVCLIASQLAMAQLRVDPSNMHERIFCIVPMTGSGTYADPKRPLFTPASGADMAGSGLLSYSYEVSDDGKTALVEFVARDRSAFAAILNSKRADTRIFERGKHGRADIEQEFKKVKKDFSFNKAKVRVQ